MTVATNAETDGLTAKVWWPLCRGGDNLERTVRGRVCATNTDDGSGPECIVSVLNHE